MASNILSISKLNPIKFVESGKVALGAYKTKHLEDWRYQETVASFMEQRNFFQPWQKSDVIRIQVLSNYAPHVLQLYRCDGALIDTFNLEYVPSSVEMSMFKVYETSVNLMGYDEGGYYFVLNSGAGPLQVLVSEVFEIREEWPHSVLVEYKHDENDFDSVFENDLQFSFRIPGGLTEYKPAMDSTVFIDQGRDIVQLSAKSFETQVLVIGNQEGVPDWLAQRVNEIFLCAEVLLDGKQYVKAEGARMEEVREENYPMAGWRLEVRPKEATNTRLFEAGAGEGTLSVVYNIESEGMGGISTPAGSNTVQIEAIGG